MAVNASPRRVRTGPKLETPSPESPVRVRRSQFGALVAVAAAGAMTVTTAAWIGTTSGSNGPNPMVVASVVGLVSVVACLYLAITKFATFIVALIALRPVLDGFHMGGQGDIFSPSTGVGVVFVACALCWLYVQWRARLLQRPSPLVLGMGLLMVAAGLSTLVSRIPIVSAIATLRLLTAYLMVVVLEQLLRSDPRMVRRTYLAVLSSAVIVSLWAVAALATGRTWFDPLTNVTRVTGPFIHPNVAAKYLTVVALLMASHVISREFRGRVSSRERYLTYLVLAVTLGCLASTLARVAWIATIAGVLYLVCRRDWRLVPAIGLLCVGLIVGVPPLTDRVADLWAPAPTAGVAENSLIWRIGYWQQLLALTRLNPINGTGFNTVPILSGEGLAAHNVWVQTLVEMGWFGVLALIVTVISIVLTIHRAGQKHRGPSYAGAVAISISLLVTMVTENLLSETTTLWYAAAGMVLAYASPSHLVERWPRPGTESGTDKSSRRYLGVLGAQPETPMDEVAIGSSTLTREC